jgi:small-conductance mechanosensitive channel
MKEFLNQTYWNNSIQDYLMALLILVIGIIVLWIFKKVILKRLRKFAEKSATVIDDILIKLIEKSLLPLAYLGLLFIALNSLNIPANVMKVLNIIVAVLITYLATRIIISALNFLLHSYAKKTDDTGKQEKQLKGIKGLLNFVIWIIALIFLLDNLGVKVSAVVAGLGIGGIAVALAAQAILGDLFSYFVIFFDRPFEVGDFIIVGDKIGAVEYIGIKTTRLKAIGGEELVFSNTDLTNSRVHNFRKMERRRVVFKVGVIYQTPAEKLKIIPAIVKEIITKVPDATFDRGHLSAFGDSSINFEFVYYVEGADYNQYMDINQSINLAIFEKFEKEGIEFAYPTQTLFLNKENN